MARFFALVLFVGFASYAAHAADHTKRQQEVRSIEGRIFASNRDCKAKGYLGGARIDDLTAIGMTFRPLADDEKEHAVRYIERTAGEKPEAPEELARLGTSEAVLAYMRAGFTSPQNGVWFIDAKTKCTYRGIFGDWYRISRVIDGTWRLDD